MMKRILNFILALTLICCMVLPCSAVEPGSEASGDVYARYANDVKPDAIPVVDGSAEATTEGGYTVSVTGIPGSAVVLRIVPIPSAETTAWAWFTNCIGGDWTILSIFDIYYEDAAGDRSNASGVNISISNAGDATAIFSVATSGASAQLDCVTKNGSIAFSADGSHYYALTKNANTAPAPGNDVTINAPEGGSIGISDKHPKTGDAVTITPIPDAGKEVEKVVVRDKRGNTIPVTDNGDGTYGYVQPDGDVTIEVTFKDKGSAPAEKFHVTIEKTTGGDVEVSDLTPIVGQTVWITPKPDNQKMVRKVTVTMKSGKTMKVTDNGDGTYSYTQPAGDVTVKVTFKNKPTSGDSGSPKTGDNSNIVAWTGLLILSALVLAWLIVRKRKENNNEG